MEFGTLRSRLHDSRNPHISWEEIRKLSKRADYLDVYVPYMSNFQRYWQEYALCKVHSITELQNCLKIAPYGHFAIELRDKDLQKFCLNPLSNKIYSLRTKPTRQSGRALFKSPYFQTLKELDISDSGMGDGPLHHSESTPFVKTLKKVSARNARLSDSSIGDIALYFPSLEYLDISSNYIGSDGAETFTFLEAPGFENLMYLDISQNGLDENAQQLLHECPHLQNCTIIAHSQEF